MDGIIRTLPNNEYGNHMVFNTYSCYPLVLLLNILFLFAQFAKKEHPTLEFDFLEHPSLAKSIFHRYISEEWIKTRLSLADGSAALLLLENCLICFWYSNSF
jgi:hypothetical protein